MPGKTFIKELLFCFCVILVIPSLACSANVYSAEEINSAMNYFSKKAEINTSLDKCSRMLGNNNVFRSIAYIWDHDNYAYELASNIIINSASDTVKRQTKTLEAEHRRLSDNNFKRLNQSGRRSFCQSLVHKVADLSLGFEKTNPDDAALLQRIIAKNNDLRIKKRNSDLTLGCVKQLLNDNNADVLEKALTMCACRTKALISNATEKEIDDWLTGLSKEADDSNTSLNNQKWFLRVNSAMEECN